MTAGLSRAALQTLKDVWPFKSRWNWHDTFCGWVMTMVLAVNGVLMAAFGRPYWAGLSMGGLELAAAYGFYRLVKSHE